ncbi:carbohydrate sulfotransferase 1-like isoform X2 [Haliotis cracherodii]|uniref:carbohydrate sulfotransferase 1-like isoform X2 n=1 Tax=Haliotis cracherodii TaxID=6455 RepID=UPI0039E733C7
MRKFAKKRVLSVIAGMMVLSCILYVRDNTGTGYLPSPLPVRTTGAPRLFTTDKESTSLFRQFSDMNCLSVQVADPPRRFPERDLFDGSPLCNTTHPCRPKAHTKVILLTYMRSGSTFTGDILSAHPDVFYFFEPLHFLSQEKHTVFDYLGLRQKAGHNHKSYIMRSTMSALLNCEFEKIDIDTLSQFHLQHSRSTKPYNDCLTANPGVLGVLRCLHYLYKACCSAQVLLSKTISLGAKMTGELMDSDPRLRVIHLVRDPRATIWAEGRFHVYKQKDFKTFVVTFCERLLTDLQNIKAIKQRNPNRAYVVLYENLAKRPLILTKELYNVMNLPMMKSVFNHVRNKSMEGHEENCSMCISKADSARTSQEWRLHLEYDKVKYIDAECQQVYGFLGYKPAESKAVYTNLSIPLHTWPEI